MKKVLLLLVLLAFTAFGDNEVKKNNNSEVQALLNNASTAYHNKDYQGALNFFDKACGLGSEKGCIVAATMLYKEGNGSDDDIIKAKSYCEKYNGNGYAYTMLGSIYFGGKAIPKNLSKAKLYFEKACDIGGEQGKDACSMLGIMYEGREGIKKDISKAIYYHKKACENGVGGACNNIGVLYLKGDDIKQNIQQAKEYLKKGCSLQYQSSCNTLHDLERGGF